jgi:hypothetical protein
MMVGRSRSIVVAVAMACALATTLGAQTRGGRPAPRPSLHDTVGVLLAVAEHGDVNLRRAPRLVPATNCLYQHVSCRGAGQWDADTMRAHALLDSVRVIARTRHSVADSVAADSVLYQRLELTAPIFYGARRDSARIEVGARARFDTSRRGYFESDAHVTLVRDRVTRRWSIVKWFTHRIT